MGDVLTFCHALKILELCKDSDLQAFIDRETRHSILKEGPKAAPQLTVKALVNIIMDDILGNTLPKCSFTQSEGCNIEEITLSTLKVLTFYGIKDTSWAIPYVEAAICKLLENNKHVTQENGNIIVEYINRIPIKNVNPRSLLRKNQALKRKYT